MKNVVKNITMLLVIFVLITGNLQAQEYWQQLNAFPGIYVHALAIDLNGRIYAGTFGNGIYRSTDEGISWLQINTGLTNNKIQCIKIHPSGNIFVGTDSGGVYRSTDNGNSWTNVGLNGKPVLSLSIKPTGDVFAGVGYPGIDTSSGVYRSTDNGTSWQKTSTGLTSSSVNALAINSVGYIFAGTGGDGVYLSTDNGISWSHSGLSGVSVTAMSIKTDTIMLSGTYLEGVYNSTDNGTTWNNLGIAFSRCRSLAFNSDGIFFAGTDREGFFRTENDGMCWYQMGLPNEIIRSLIIGNNGYIFAGTDVGIYRSLNTSKKTFAVDICTLNFGTLIYPPIASIVDSFAVANTTSSSISISSISIPDTSFQIEPKTATINSGQSIWFKVTFTPKIARAHRTIVSLFSNSTAFPEMVILNANAQMGTIRLLQKNIVFNSVNIGTYRDTTFTFRNTGNDTLEITNVISTNPVFNIVHPINGIYMINTSDHLGTIRFTPLYEGLTSGDIIIYSNTPTSPDTIHISGTGVQPTGVGEEFGLPYRFVLEQNYPNPFNPTTSIGYSIPQSGYVSLKVLNLIGQEVASLVSENKPAGDYTVQWNADVLPSGIYFYRLQSGTFTETKKLTLLR